VPVLQVGIGLKPEVQDCSLGLVPDEQLVVAMSPPVQVEPLPTFPVEQSPVASVPFVQPCDAVVPSEQLSVAPCGIKRFLLRPKDSGLSSKGGI